MKVFRRLTLTLCVFMLVYQQGIQGSANTNLQCTDWEGQKIPEGSQFKARLDPCETCICEGGHAVSCFSPGCAAPPDCKDSILEEVKGECCQFNCIKPADLPPDFKKINNTIIINSHNPTTYGGVDNANLGLRLVASTVTSFLILALLLFMVHRLRQRRILIMMRRINEEQSQDEAVAYMSHFDHYDMGIEFPPYEDPPPPYTPHKPQDIPLGEAPPPYQANLPNNNNNIGEGGGLENGSVVNGTRPLQGSISHGINAQYWLGRRSPSGSVGREDCAVSDSSLSNVSTPSTAPVSPSGSPIVVSYDNFRTSASRVMVIMENNSPRSSLVLGAGRISSQEGSDGAANRSSGYMHRSNSVEVKVGSCNPRNSYSHVSQDDTSPKRVGAAACAKDDHESDLKAPADEDEDESQGEEGIEMGVGGASANGLGGVNLSWNRGIRPERISLRGLSGFASSTASSPSSTNSNSPELGMGVANSLSRQASSNSDASSTHAIEPPPDIARPVVGTRRSPVATWGPLCSIDKPRATQRNHIGASGQSMSMSSSAAVPEVCRSASMTSQFSVCSETGEKRPRMSLPVAIPNDVQYPDVLFNRFSAPEHPDIISPGHASGASGPSTPGDVNDLVSPGESLAETEIAAAANQSRRPRPRIVYVDMNCNNVSNNVPTEAAAAGPIHNSNVGGPEDTEALPKVKRSGLHGSQQGTQNDDSTNTQDQTKNVARKLKLRNQKSKDSGEQVLGHTSSNRRMSPEFKRTSIPKTDKSSTYKQYGFVDGPDRISRQESTANSIHGRERSVEKSRDGSNEKRRESSREKRTESAERRERSQEQGRGKSKERSSSRNSSKERQRKSLQNNQTRNRSRSSERTRRSEHTDNRDIDTNQRNTLTNYGQNELISNEERTQAPSIARVHSRNKKDSRPLERHPTQHSASLERRNKRRPEDTRYIPETSHVMAAILTNGHSNGMTNGDSSQNDWHNSFQSENLKSRSHVKDHHQQPSIPLMSASWNDADR